MPGWCAAVTRGCGFLLPLETRLLYLQVTASGLARALTAMQMRFELAGSTHNEELRVARLQRVKVRVSRDKVLGVCTKVMDRYAASPAVLEVEYKGEVGTGLGPTLEFYALASRAFVDDTLGLWRDCHNVMGLYPAPLPADSNKVALPACPPCIGKNVGYPRSGILVQRKKAVRLYRTLGQLFGRALLDGRLVDVQLTRAFYRWLLGDEEGLGEHDLREVDATLHQSLEQLRKMDGPGLAGLCLDFTLPGYPEWEMRAGGADVAVGPDNINEFIMLVIRHTLVDAVRPAMEAFLAGFDSVLSLSKLQGFSPEELAVVLGGTDEAWSAERMSSVPVVPIACTLASSASTPRSAVGDHQARPRLHTQEVCDCHGDEQAHIVHGPHVPCVATYRAAKLSRTFLPY